VNAAERFFAAARDRDLEAASAELAEAVVMRNPATDDPVVGREAVNDALRAVESACDEFRHTHLLSGSGEDGELFGLVFEARVGEVTLGGVDLLRLDEDDKIASFTVAARPVSSLMALGARMADRGDAPPTG
jgi:SnoaL-like domain